jgi:hypothetical protein
MMHRWAGGRNERYAENAAELVRFKVDVMLRRQPRLGGKACDIRHPNGGRGGIVSNPRAIEASCMGAGAEVAAPAQVS